MRSLLVSLSQAWPVNNRFLFSTEKAKNSFITVKAQNSLWNQEYWSHRRKKCYKTAKQWLWKDSEPLFLLKK